MTSVHHSAAERERAARRLLDSSAVLSLDPLLEVDWDAPLDTSYYGLSPEWSALFGTRYWSEMDEDQRKELTRQEIASIFSTGIWFETVLQQIVLRDFYAADPTDPNFQWALTEVADECRHSIMFARSVAKLRAPRYRPHPAAVRAGRWFAAMAGGEAAYAAILVAEEVLDVLQRASMCDERVLPLVRTVNNIHVVEESRHMKFARAETRDRLSTASTARRHASAVVIASVAFYIVEGMVSRKVYRTAGLDVARAVREAAANEHRKAVLRSSCAGLMDFLHSCGLLTRPAVAIYRRANLI
ncbi:AurF N-oxygenase family protein [Actinokineospora pegani]|uniref:AurF N-oxygenase family protein n=1 Tax=Actinokineospora pegani TaxID=2654637 RepID=UPI0012E99E54|nr:diiron oxygenase [Actinokineospora pegani]